MLLAPLLDLLVPHRCVSCLARAEPPWCDTCRADAASRAIDQATSCGCCAGGGPGHECWAGRPPVRALSAAFRYSGPVADAVVAGKVGGAHAVWRPLGALLAACVDRRDVDVVTWVPAAGRRRRARGFDHAQLLAEGLADRLALPVAALLAAPEDLPDRGSVDAHDRAQLPDDVYRGPASVRGRVLLVDDVLTTGATLTQAARPLTAAGAVVRGAVLARAGAYRLGGGAGAVRPGRPDTSEPS